MERIRKGVRQCGIISVIFSILAALIVIFAGPLFCRLFVGPENHRVIDLSMIYLVINGSLYFILALPVCLPQRFTGTGQNIYSNLGWRHGALMRIFVAFTLASTLGFASVHGQPRRLDRRHDPSDDRLLYSQP